MIEKKYILNLKTALLLQGVFVISLFLIGCEKPIQPVQLTGNTMGTAYSIRYFENNRVRIGQKQIQIGIDSLLAEINRQMSTFDPESEISRFNAWQGKGHFNISNHFRNVAERSLAWQKVTNGAFDVTVLPLVELWGFGPGRWKTTEGWEPPKSSEIESMLAHGGSGNISLSTQGLSKNSAENKLDLSAIAKGYAVDQTGEFLKKHHIADFLIEIGGEMKARGNKPDGNHWKIGIDNPATGTGKREILDEKVQLFNNALATSGNYRNFYTYNGEDYSHLIDPRSGYPVKNRIASVSVITKNCMDADALATALVVLGYEEGRAFIESLSGYEAIWVLKNEEGFESRVSEGLKLESENIYAAGSSD